MDNQTRQGERTRNESHPQKEFLKKGMDGVVDETSNFTKTNIKTLEEDARSLKNNTRIRSKVQKGET
jgi:hypothetical protein